MSRKLFGALLVLAVIVGVPAITQAQLLRLSETHDPLVGPTPLPPVVSSHLGVLVELCVAIDGSGSISPADFDLQIDGLAAAVVDPATMPQSGIVQLSVVQFGSGTWVEVHPTVIDSQATADAVGMLISNIVQDNGATFMGEAIAECSGLFMDEENAWIIDISTDGNPNGPSNPLEARDSAVDDGLDALNALGVGEEVNISCSPPPEDVFCLERLVYPSDWPVGGWDPFEPGFVIAVDDFTEYQSAIGEKIAGEVPVEVALDVKPGSCPNPLNFRSQGVLPVAILGTEDFDVTDIDISTVLLQGVPPIRSSAEFVAAPYEPFLGKETCADCTEMDDLYMDLTLKFEKQEIVAAMGDVADGTCAILTLTGELLNGRLIVGEDVVIVKNR